MKTKDILPSSRKAARKRIGTHRFRQFFFKKSEEGFPDTLPLVREGKSSPAIVFNSSNPQEVYATLRPIRGGRHSSRIGNFRF